MTILFVTQLPPPLHGQSAVSAALLEQIRSATDQPVAVVDTSPRSRDKSLSYHVRRMASTAQGIVSAVLNAASSGKTFYSVVDSGLGQIYNIAVLLACRGLRYRMFLHHHTADHNLHFRPMFALLSFVSGRRAIHVATSDGMAANLRARYRSVGQCVVCHPAGFLDGGDPPARRNDTGPKNGRIRLGVLGNMTFEKGLRDAVSIVASLRASGLSVDLLVGGPIVGAAENEFAQSLSANPGGGVSFLGPLDGAGKSRFFETIDAFLFPSTYRNETQGIVNMEALAGGVPVFAYDVGYVSELLGPDIETYSGREALQEGLRRAIGRWLAEPAAYGIACAAARRRYEEIRSTGLAQVRTLVAMLSSSPGT